MLYPEKTREGCPTEENGDSNRTNERGPFFFGWVVGACRAGTRGFCSALAALVGPVQNIIFFLTVTLFQSLYPHRLASWAGSRAVLHVS